MFKRYFYILKILVTSPQRERWRRWQGQVKSWARSSGGHLVPQATSDGGYLDRALRQTRPSRDPTSPSRGRAHSGQVGVPSVHPNAPAGSIQRSGINRLFHGLTSPPFPPDGRHSGPHGRTHHNAGRGREIDTREPPAASWISPSRVGRTDLSKPRGKRSSGSAGSPARAGQEVPPSSDRQRPPRHAERRRRKASSKATSAGARLGRGAGLTLRAQGRRRTGRWARRGAAPAGFQGGLGALAGDHFGSEQTSQPLGWARIKRDPLLYLFLGSSEIV